jgi:hypothetical protein
MFAMAVAGLVLAAVSGTSQAAPIAPRSAVVTNDGGTVTQVHWHCWIGRWGHRHCGY